MNMTYQTGIYTSDGQAYDALRKDLIAELVWLKTLDYIDFMDAVVMENTDVLDKHLRFPKDHTLPTFQINEGASSEYQKMGWFERSFSLNKFRSKLMIDDESRIRLDEATQWQYSMTGVARGMAQARDNEILGELWNGAGTSSAASTPWNSDAADPIGDIANLIEDIFSKEESNVTEDELRNVVVYYPLKLFGRVRIPEMLMKGDTDGNMGRMIVDSSAVGWVSSELGFSFRGSRKLNNLNTAIAVIKGPQTAVHYSYTGGKIPTVETVRDADEGADAWMITQYYKTQIMPQNYNQQTTNDRIIKITNVST
ncbi:MAG: hypothetical protein WC877_00250 [Dehalococcoidales bacterium]|jgi:hypothetical protein